MRRRPDLRLRRAFVVVLALIVLVCTPVLVVVLASGRTAVSAVSAGPPRPPGPLVDGIVCEPRNRTAFRARTHLEAFADGKRITVPAGIGALRSCRYWLHTDATDGVVHITSPVRRRFTLGNLFDIWGVPLTRDRALGFKLGPHRRLRVFVDGKRAGGDPRRIALADGRRIALVIGRAPRSLTFR